MKNIIYFLIGFCTIAFLMIAPYAFAAWPGECTIIHAINPVVEQELQASGTFPFKEIYKDQYGAPSTRNEQSFTDITYYRYPNSLFHLKYFENGNWYYAGVRELNGSYYNSLYDTGVEWVDTLPPDCNPVDPPEDCSTKEGQEAFVSLSGQFPSGTQCSGDCEVDVTPDGLQLYTPDELATYVDVTYTGQNCEGGEPVGDPPGCEEIEKMCSDVCKGDLTGFVCGEDGDGWDCGCPDQTPPPLTKDSAGDYVPDTDKDGEPNSIDMDSDNDGEPNSTDTDVDGDNLGNRYDNDIDGDGVGNGGDYSSWNPSRGSSNGLGADDDVDGDGVLNGSDDDVDGDGIPNGVDPDIDGDGVGNGADLDADGDGIPDGSDSDADGDGLSNTDDLDPDGSGSESGDLDGDGEQEGEEEETEEQPTGYDPEEGLQIDLQPLKDSVDSLTESFPVNVVTNMVTIAEKLKADPQAPTYTWSPPGFGTYEISLDDFSPIAQLLRWFFMVCLTIGMCMLVVRQWSN